MWSYKANKKTTNLFPLKWMFTQQFDRQMRRVLFWYRAQLCKRKDFRACQWVSLSQMSRYWSSSSTRDREFLTKLSRSIIITLWTIVITVKTSWELFFDLSEWKYLSCKSCFIFKLSRYINNSFISSLVVLT